jgi:DNA transformation protein
MRMLAVAGICSLQQLREFCSVGAFLAVKKTGQKPSINLLFAIEGALTDRDWKDIAKNERLSLLLRLDEQERKCVSEMI